MGFEPARLGKYADFRRAVDAKDGEKIVLSWQVWPDKSTPWLRRS
jgi:uncharacterized protein YbaA (DUF1428 family)